jgi:hypothetical protein
METGHKTKLKARMDKDKKKWIAVVRNLDGDGEGLFELKTNFYSDYHTFENVLHKIELDLMTNLHNGFRRPIEVKIAEVQ